MQYLGAVTGGLQQGLLRLTDAHALEALLVHRQVIQGIARDQYIIHRLTQVLDQTLQGTALVDATGQAIQIHAGGEQQVAVQRFDGSAQLVGYRIRLTEPGAAALLRHLLTLQPGEGGQFLQNKLLARPARINLALHRVDRLQGLTIHYGGADIADDVIGLRDRRIREQRHHHLKTAAGDKDQSNARVRADQLVKPLAIVRVASKKGSIQVSSQHHD